MKFNLYLYIIILLLFSACDKPVFEKPDNLVKKDQFVDMLVDMHLAESAFSLHGSTDTLVGNSSSESFYKGVLQKYEVPDSVFEKSFVYYASKSKEFEKIYMEVINKLNEKQQDYLGMDRDILEFER